MKIYNTNVNLQNFGTAFLVIIRGKLQDVKETFNSFYNWGATSGQLDLSENAVEATGIFWTNDANLRRYWTNRFSLANPQIEDKVIYGVELTSKFNGDFTFTYQPAIDYVNTQMEEFRKSSEKFMTFDKSYLQGEYKMGTISAEKPDWSFKDATQVYISKKQAEA
jgi:hypothetical protein